MSTHAMDTSNRMPRLRALLDMPVIGFVPWILLSVIDGPGRVVLACALAGGLALLISVAGAIAGLRFKILDVAAVVFFAAVAVIAAATGPGTNHWLGLWSGELSNVAIAVIAIGSIVFRTPFTIQYARETTDPRYWRSPLFLRINYVITAVWAAAFLLTAVVGYIGDGPLHQPDNIWTSWIIQIALVVLAIKFTGWYPEYATHKTEAAPSGGPGRKRPLSDLFRPLAAYLVPVGILIMVVGNSLWWAGLILVVAGIVITRHLHQAVKSSQAEPARVPAAQGAGEHTANPSPPRTSPTGAEARPAGRFPRARVLLSAPVGP